MMVMEMLMIIMMSCLALALFLSWRSRKKERSLYAEKLDELTGELRRIHEDNKHLRDEAAMCYAESECSYEKICRDLHDLKYCVDELRWAISTSKAVNKDEAEKLRNPFFHEEEERHDPKA